MLSGEYYSPTPFKEARNPIQARFLFWELFDRKGKKSTILAVNMALIFTRIGFDLMGIFSISTEDYVENRIPPKLNFKSPDYY